MGLRFFADHCIPNAIVQRLLDAGHEVLRLNVLSGVGPSHVFDFISGLLEIGPDSGLRRAVLGLELVREGGPQV